MSKKKPNGASRHFVMIYDDLLSSSAWHSMGINTRRLIDFLMLEWIRHNGRQNGFLLAPRKQLIAFGIHHHFISAAIAEAEKLGLIDVIRGKGRIPSRYALTWLPLKGETMATDRWRACDQPAASLTASRKQAKTRLPKNHIIVNHNQALNYIESREKWPVPALVTIPLVAQPMFVFIVTKQHSHGGTKQHSQSP
jgi:hypothetical protein